MLAPGERLLRTWPLAGGTSAQVDAAAIATADGGTRRVVIRRHAGAAAEHARLVRLLAAGLPVPAPLALLAEPPRVVTAFVDGAPPAMGGEAAAPDDAPATPDGAPVASLAAALAALHRVPLAPGDLATFPPRTPPGRNAPVLLHGDFWPGNTLWRAGRLVAVIDWEDAGSGDPLADLANGRLEVLWAFGEAALAAFTAAYAAAMPHVDLTELPAWDLAADARLTPRIAGWGLPAARLATMRARSEAFVARARAQSG